MSFIGTQAHLQTKLLRTECYKVLKIIGISPTEQIQEEVKLQSFILSLLLFFAGERCMETPVKDLMKGQRITGAHFRLSV